MPGLTATEKEHWKDCIGKRIDSRSKPFRQKTRLCWRVHREARKRALASLGLSQMQQELDEVEQQQAALEKRQRQIQRAMLAHVRGVPVEDIDDYHA